MVRVCLAALFGAYLLLAGDGLPERSLLLPCALLAVALAWKARHAGLAVMLAGYLLTWAAADEVVADRLQASYARQDIILVAQIAEFPTNRLGRLRLVVRTLEPQGLPRSVRLSWHGAERVPSLGETWRLTVRLRRPRGFLNPGTFDYEGWLFQKRVAATGYVIASADNRLLTEAGVHRVARSRQGVVSRLARLFPDDAAAAVLAAVTVGARHQISTEQWQRFAATGTSHLMAISGLHIGLVAGGLFLMIRRVAAFCRSRMNVNDVAVILALAGALAYGLMSGLAVPSRRALLMLAIVGIAVLARRPVSVSWILAVACILVTFANPLALMTPGFKLSFAAVAILLWSSRQHRRSVTTETDTAPPRRMMIRLTESFRSLNALQFALLVGLFPLTAAIFGRVAWLSPVSNLMILPIFSFVTVPFALVGALLDGPLQIIGDQLLSAAWYSVRAALWIVDTIYELQPFDSAIGAPVGPQLLVALLALTWVILPPGWPGRGLGGLAMLATVIHRPEPIPADCLDLQVLDVGHGLSVVAEGPTHAFVYDTGPAFRSGTDTGALVVVPYLLSRGIRHLDTLVVSHGDLDHSGGAATVINGLGAARLLVGERLETTAYPQIPCHAGDSWYRDGFRYTVLHPARDSGWHGNNASCMVRIDIGKYAVLLTGDIEIAAENSVMRDSRPTRANVVIIPHHGSKTSSSQAFVTQLQPDLAIASTGHGNRWGFPAPEVVQRWQTSGARVLNTADDGAVGLRVCKGSGLGKLLRQRKDRRRFWHER